MADQTFGQMLLNEKLPDDLKFDGPVTKGDLRKAMTTYAQRDPKNYVKAVQDIKKVGDQVATWEGISVGLDDIAPDYKNRDTILNDALKKVKSAKSDDARRKILYDTEDKIKKVTEEHPSDMTLMARSGGRGSIPQLMKTVASPVVASNSDGKAYPWLIKHSYAQGLSPSETWVSGSEARRNAIASTGSVVEPGAVAKVVVSNMEDLVVTKGDCGTRAGVKKSVDDPNIVDRYLAQSAGPFSYNELVTPDVVQTLKKKRIKEVDVRSPMTCDINDGVCQKCMGQNSWGKDYEIGMNVGSRSAQALTEPLTQFVLNAKHGVRMVGGNKKDTKLRGLDGFRTLTEVPKSFTEKAALAKHDGRVTKVTEAPQGGHNIFVDGTRHYTPPGLDPKVKQGDRVEKGDALSYGTPMPDEVVESKGVGEGRRYLSTALNDLYQRQGVDIDHRHTELLARKAMNYVRIEDDPTDTLIEGDVVPFEKVKPLYRKSQNEVDLEEAEGKYLAGPVLHYTEGTRITPSVVSKLRENNVKSVAVAKKAPEFTPIMKSMIRTPLLKEDWMSRLSHRYLKKTLTEGAGFGYESDTESTNPVPAYISRSDFGHKPSGKYASLHGKHWSEEKVANVGSFLRGTKKLLFGKGDDALKTMLRAEDAPIRYIGSGGAIDNAGLQASRWKKWLGDKKFKQLDITDEAGRVTEEGAHKLRGLENAAGGFGQRMEYDDVAQEALEQAKIDPDMFNSKAWKQMQEARGGRASRTAKGLGKLLIGDNPINISKQRYHRGGIFGRGGLLFGDLGVDPDLVRAVRDYRAGGERAKGAVGRGLWSGGADLLGNKFLSYGLPGYGVYEALTREENPEESKALNVVTPVAETLGWGVGTPFGGLGGTLIAGQMTNAAQALTGAVDPKAKKVLDRRAQKTKDKAVHERVYSDMHQTVQAHPMYAAQNYARQGAYSTKDYWDQWRSQQQQQQQKPQARPGSRYANSGPGPGNNRIG